MLEMTCVLIWAVVIWVYMCVKFYQDIHVQFTVLCHNKKTLKNKSWALDQIDHPHTRTFHLHKVILLVKRTAHIQPGIERGPFILHSCSNKGRLLSLGPTLGCARVSLHRLWRTYCAHLFPACSVISRWYIV